MYVSKFPSKAACIQQLPGTDPARWWAGLLCRSDSTGEEGEDQGCNYGSKIYNRGFSNAIHWWHNGSMGNMEKSNAIIMRILKRNSVLQKSSRISRMMIFQKCRNISTANQLKLPIAKWLPIYQSILKISTREKKKVFNVHTAQKRRK